ncbi:hypothetical protein AOQ84DRAFT_371881 [Glonium stellatum]|uniref:Uncharacterized protein n=1 Tax=Glonium stellatum TaxID=574774 RepID=A0A8E2FB55_9PEZI|nr:hypothetical protein AOQ84DRAFT_371881 [Glonium stellatum]
MASNDTMNDVAEIRDTEVPYDIPSMQTPPKHGIVEGRPSCSVSSSAREGDLDILPRVTVSPRPTWDETPDVPLADDTDRPTSNSMCDFPLPSYICSAASTPTLSSSNASPPAESELIWPEGSPQTPYARCVQRLNRLHPGVQKHIPSIIELGDSFLREDVVTSLTSFCRRWSQTDLCHRPTSASDELRIKSLLRGHYQAEAFKCRSVVDRLKLRFLRILLYHDFEGLRKTTWQSMGYCLMARTQLVSPRTRFFTNLTERTGKMSSHRKVSGGDRAFEDINRSAKDGPFRRPILASESF